MQKSFTNNEVTYRLFSKDASSNRSKKTKKKKVKRLKKENNLLVLF